MLIDMKRVLIIVGFCLCVWGMVYAHEYVYIIHGLGSAKLWMRGMDKHVKKNGFRTVNWGYRSRFDSLNNIAYDLYTDIKNNDLCDTVSFVTHSMGGLVVRALLQYSKTDSLFPLINRMVMLSPPNEGSHVANFFASMKIGRIISGPNLEVLQTDSSSEAKHLPIPYDAEVGIIAGIRVEGKGYNPCIEGEDDMLVTPDQMTLGVEKDFFKVKEMHFFMPQNEKVKSQVVYFLKNGHFNKDYPTKE